MSDARRPNPPPLPPQLFVAFGVLLGVLVALSLTRLGSDGELELLDTVSRIAEEEFFEEVDRTRLFDGAARGMLDSLDPYSEFYGPETIAQLDRETSGEFLGIGVVFAPPTHEGRVLFPFPGSPAAEAGLAVGDRFLEIEGTPVGDDGRAALEEHLRTNAGETIGVLVEGRDGARRQVRITPRRLVDPTVRHERMLSEEGGLGYVSVLAFSHRTPQEFREALARLRERGMRSLVVDLRSNPGGILEAAVEIADLFLASGTIVVTRTREGARRIDATPPAPFAETPLVLLIDGRSASASEVLSGALQDHAAAALVGETTYGKGTVQTLTRIGEDRAIVKVTTAHYYTPSWRAIDRGAEEGSRPGIAPDLAVTLSARERVEIHAHLHTYTPPAELLEQIEDWEEEEERTLLAPPPEDRQLDAAVALLSGRLPDAEGLR